MQAIYLRFYGMSYYQLYYHSRATRASNASTCGYTCDKCEKCHVCGHLGRGWDAKKAPTRRVRAASLCPVLAPWRLVPPVHLTVAAGVALEREERPPTARALTAVHDAHGAPAVGAGAHLVPPHGSIAPSVHAQMAGMAARTQSASSMMIAPTSELRSPPFNLSSWMLMVSSLAGTSPRARRGAWGTPPTCPARDAQARQPSAGRAASSRRRVCRPTCGRAP